MRPGSRRSKAAVELPLAARTPFVGPGVGEAQDLVLAQPSHRVQAQLPHPLHEGLGAVPAVGGHPAYLENLPGPGVERLPQQGQARVDGRLPAGGGPRRSGGGTAWRPGTAGRRGGRRRPPRCPRRPAGRPPGPGGRRGPCRSRTSPGPRFRPRSWARSWRPGPAAPRPAAAAPPPGRPRPGAQRESPAQTSAHGCAPTGRPQCSRVVKLTRSGCHSSSSTRWAKWSACGLPQGARASILCSNRTAHLCR